MAKEIQAYVATGSTLYAVLLNSVGQIWNGTSFVTIASGDWGDYDIPLTEATAGLYFADMPAVGAGVYNYVVYTQAGASPATTDTQSDNRLINWDGTAVLPLSGVEDKIDVIDGIVDDILVDTGTTIPSTMALEATLTAIKGVGWVDENLTTIDANVDAILVDTGTTIPGTITTIDNEIAVIDGIVDDILVDTGTTIPGSMALEATLTAMKGAGWTDETLVAIKAVVDGISSGSLDAAGIRTAVGLASANLDTQLSNIQTSADGVLDEVIEGTLTATEVLRIILSALAGKLSGSGTGTLRFRDTLDTKDRIIAVMDGTNNRSSVVLDES